MLIATVLKMEAEKTVYISCNPAILARNLALFIKGYRVDCSPLICLLERTTLISIISFFYFQHGIPLVSDLENRTDIISVQIMQGDENILLSDSKNIKQATQVAEMLSYRFGKAEGGQVDTVFVFTFKDGSKIELGANSTTVFSTL